MFTSYNVTVYTSNLPASTMASYTLSIMRQTMTPRKVVCLQWIPKKPASNLPFLLICPTHSGTCSFPVFRIRHYTATIHHRYHLSFCWTKFTQTVLLYTSTIKLY